MPQALPNERLGSAFYLCIILSYRCKPLLFSPVLAATVCTAFITRHRGIVY